MDPHAGEDWQEYLRSLEVFGMRPGLERVVALLDLLDHPERSFRSIHVVGTNGKSSTTRYAASVLQAHGLHAAAYLSPHIAGFHERLLIDGRPVAADAFGAAVGKVRRASATLATELDPVTQFEALTVAALLAAAECGVEAAARNAATVRASNCVTGPTSAGRPGLSTRTRSIAAPNNDAETGRPSTSSRSW